MTLLAAFQTLLHRYSGQDEIVVGTPIAGRTRVEVEGLIGFFVNMLVLRTDAPGDPTFRELLKRVKKVALGAYAHHDIPFEKVVEELHPRRDPSRNPLFQVAFALQNTPRPSPPFSGLKVSTIAAYRNIRFDLEVHLTQVEDGLHGLFVYPLELSYPRERLAFMLEDANVRVVLNVYGPTENTTFTTWHRIESVGETATTVPIGSPISLVCTSSIFTRTQFRLALPVNSTVREMVWRANT